MLSIVRAEGVFGITPECGQSIHSLHSIRRSRTLLCSMHSGLNSPPTSRYSVMAFRIRIRSRSANAEKSEGAVDFILSKELQRNFSRAFRHCDTLFLYPPLPVRHKVFRKVRRCVASTVPRRKPSLVKCD